MKVLFVDDDEVVRMTFAALLEDAGLRVTEAGSLREARARLAEGPYALVVIDNALPDGHGGDLVPLLAAEAKPPRVALLSGSELVDARVNVVLRKSAAPEELIAQLTQLAMGD